MISGVARDSSTLVMLGAFNIHTKTTQLQESQTFWPLCQHWDCDHFAVLSDVDAMVIANSRNVPLTPGYLVVKDMFQFVELENMAKILDDMKATT